jgi:Mitochondrial ribosomal protein L51 / S25 / CI-B8 domain
MFFHGRHLPLICREFLSSWLNRFQEENSHLVVEEVVRRGQHPSIIGFYANGNIRAVDLKNKDSGEILRQAALLRSSAGRKSTVQVKDRLQTKLPSVQGRWNSALQDKLSSSQ